MAAGLTWCFAFVTWAASLNGCAVAVYRISAPERLPANVLPPLTRSITFDVCLDRNGRSLTAFEAERGRAGEEIRTELAKAGVTARLESSAESPVHFTVTPGWQSEGDVSWILSALTFSVVPGYGAERRTLDVNLAPADATQGRRPEHLHYLMRTQIFMWLPFIVYPDLVGTLDGGWESLKKREVAFTQMVGRLGDDIRARWGGEGATSRPGVKEGVTCPPPAP